MHVIFYNGASYASEYIVNGLKTRLGLDEITLIDHQAPYEVDGLNIHYMDVDDVTYLEYPGGIDRCAPLDQDVVCSMAKCEIECMTMFDKAAKVGRRLVWHRRRIKRGKPIFRHLSTTEPYDRRKFYYLAHLRFWSDYLDQHKVSAFFMATVPYAMWDFILYHLCKQRQIPVVFFQHILVDGHSLPTTSIEGPDCRLQKKILEVAAEYRGRENEIPLCEASEAFIRKHTDRTKDPKWEYADMSSNEFTSVGPLRSFLTYLKATTRSLLKGDAEFTRWQAAEILTYDFCLRFLKDLEWSKLTKFWDRHADFRIDGTPYVYVALAYQPEISTCPSGGVYTNQEMMIQQLAANLPEGVVLAVKEHPAQKALSRNLDFYEWLLTVPNVRLVPRNYNTYRLIESATAAATVTGSIIMESLFRAIPVLAFGEHNAVYAPGIFRVRNSQDVRDAFKKIIEDNVRPSVEKGRIFLGAIERLWFRCDNWGRQEHELKRLANLTLEENGRSMAEALASTYLQIVADNPDIVDDHKAKAG